MTNYPTGVPGNEGFGNQGFGNEASGNETSGSEQAYWSGRYESLPISQSPAPASVEGADAEPTTILPQLSPAHTAMPTAYLTAPTPKKSRRGLATIAAVAILAAGVGGGTGVAVDRALSGNTATANSSVATGTSTVTKVVQANSSSPNWTVVADAVSKSVVSISVSTGQSGDEGTGVVLDNAGHIVTNNHVVSSAGSGATITVQVGNKTYPATVVGTDASTDLAVIKIANPPSSLTPISLADSSSVHVGDAVMAVGNPLGLADTVTTGIVSALNRPVVTQQVSTSVSDGSSGGNVYTNAIQTSAPINPGNSGGALVNASGQLIGINSSIASLSSSSTSTSQSGSIGIGFAIPSNQVKDIADQLISKGSAQHAYLGISTQDDSATLNGVSVQGAKVATVVSGSAAASAGLKAGDLIVGINGTTVGSSDALVALVRAADVGEKVTIDLIRGGGQQSVTATLGTAPTQSSSQQSQQSQTSPWGVTPGR